MRFIVDENAGPVVAKWLAEQGHDVFSVYEQLRGAEDDAILYKAYKEDRILITCDKDFGEKVYREGHPHTGIILLRLNDQRSLNRLNAMKRLLEKYSARLAGEFIVVTEKSVRFAKI